MGVYKARKPSKRGRGRISFFFFFLRFNCKGEEGRSTQIYPSTRQDQGRVLSRQNERKTAQEWGGKRL